MDNAASRENFASNVYALGVAATKEAVLSRLPPELSAMHRRGDIHIHDLEFFGQLYNCCTPTWYRYLQRHRFLGASDCGRIAETFDEIERLVTRLAVVQSGGIGFGNLDIDLERLFDGLALEKTERNREFLEETVARFIGWINTVHTRFCRESYYLTVNLGLATGFWGRAFTKAMIRAFERSPKSYTRPNIVFKVSGKVNASPRSANYDLYQMALHRKAHDSHVSALGRPREQRLRSGTVEYHGLPHPRLR